MLNKQTITLKIPQMGEGLRQVKIIKFLKKPGDFIKEDEVIYEMETDKSAVEIESSFTGYLKKWLVLEGQIVDIGSDIAIIKLKDNDVESTLSSHVSQKAEQTLFELKLNTSSIPPRVLKYCNRKGLSDKEIKIIPQEGKTLSIQDIDRYILRNRKENENNIKFFSHQQNLLIKRFKNNNSQIIATSTVSVFKIKYLKDKRKRLVKEYNKSLADISVTDFQVFAYVIAKLSSKFSKLRARVIDDISFVEDKQLNMGIATQTFEKELGISLLESCDHSLFDDFIFQFYEKVGKTVTTGNSISTNSPHIVLSYLGSDSKILYGSPLLVYPSVATIFLGGTQKSGSTHISITFDHRIINGSDIEEIINEFLYELQR